MKSYRLLLGVLVAFALACPSFGGGWTKKNVSPRHSSPMMATVTNQDRELTRMKAYKAAVQEMGDNPDEMDMLKRVEEITDKLLREAFPEAYVPAPTKAKFAASDDIWENGTVVRYLARALAFLMLAGGLYALNDKDVPRNGGRRTVKDAAPRLSISSKRSSTRPSKTSSPGSISRKTK